MILLQLRLQLGLNISPNGVRRLEDALEEYTHSEIISDYKVRLSQTPNSSTMPIEYVYQLWLQGAPEDLTYVDIVSG